LQAQAEVRLGEMQTQSEQELRRRELELQRQLEAQSREADARLKQELQQKELAFQEKLKQREQELTARADALASLEVLYAQLTRYPDLPKDPQQLHEFCNKQDHRFVDSRGKFLWKDGEAAFNFGKYKGELLRKLAKDNRDYLEWIVNEGKFPQDVIDLCWKALRGEFPKRERRSRFEQAFGTKLLPPDLLQ